MVTPQNSQPPATLSQPQVAAAELWRQLDFAQPPEVFCSAWLQLQRLRLSMCTAAVVVVRDPRLARFRPVASFPETGPVSDSLSRIAERALAEREGQIEDEPSGSAHSIAFPLIVADVLEGVVAVQISSGIDPAMILDQLQWGAVWLRAYIGQRTVDDTEQTNQRLILGDAVFVM